MEAALHRTTLHYNQDVAFFKSFLDPYMKYTSALFVREGEALLPAIRRMLDLHLEFAALPASPKILEVGCGWGSLLRRLLETRHDFEYLGISPSEVQNEFIREDLLLDQPEALRSVRTMAFEDLNPSEDQLGRYDAIFLSGSFCHLREKSEQMQKIHALLAPRGRVIIEDTFFLTEELYAQHAEHPLTRFVQNDIFGFAHILAWPTQKRMFEACGFNLVHFLDHTTSYKRTIDFWMESLKANQAPLASSYVRYMAIAQKGWNYTIGNYLVALEKAQ